MHGNPFSFSGFITEIGESRDPPYSVDYISLFTVCITIAPAFFSAAIYITLSQMYDFPLETVLKLTSIVFAIWVWNGHGFGHRCTTGSSYPATLCPSHYKAREEECRLIPQEAVK